MRGGKRIGAGRPKSQTAKRSVQIRIPEHLADRLPKRPAALIEKLLINHFNTQNMTKLVNLTPHDVTIKDVYNVLHTFDKTEWIARVASVQRKEASLETEIHSAAGGATAFSVFSNSFGDVYLENKNTGERKEMPARQDGVVYIVSTMVAQALPHRIDVVCPNSTDAVKNESGHIRYTNGFMLP